MRFYEYPRLVSILEKLLRNGFAQFEKVNVPTLIIWGESDELFPKENAEIMHQKIKNSEVKYIKGNHDWCLFRPEELLQLI